MLPSDPNESEEDDEIPFEELIWLKTRPIFQYADASSLDWSCRAGQPEDIFAWGKWYPVGTTLQSGYKIVGDDGKGTLKMSWNGLPVSVAMQGSTIQPYTPPPAMPMAPAWMGGGALSTSEEAMKDYLYDFEGNQRTAEDMEKLFMIDQMKRKQFHLKYPNSIPQEEMYQ